MSWELREGRSSGPDLVELIVFAIVKIIGPNLSFPNSLFLLDVELHELIVISRSVECSLLRVNLKSPNLTVAMRVSVGLLFLGFDITSGNDTVIVTNQHFSIEQVKGGSDEMSLEVYLLHKLVCALAKCMNAKFEVLSV